jgi:hypothetical protein
VAFSNTWSKAPALNAKAITLNAVSAGWYQVASDRYTTAEMNIPSAINATEYEMYFNVLIVLIINGIEDEKNMRSYSNSS